MYPTFRYHPTEAPTGRKFTDDAEFAALGPEWVDTPAKFPAPEPVSDVDSVIAADAEALGFRRRGRKPKEAA